MRNHQALVDKIDYHEAEKVDIALQLQKAGPEIISLLQDFMSIRAIARKTGFSPTYISFIGNGETLVSRGAYIRLVKLWKEEEVLP